MCLALAACSTQGATTAPAGAGTAPAATASASVAPSASGDKDAVPPTHSPSEAGVSAPATQIVPRPAYVVAPTRLPGAVAESWNAQAPGSVRQLAGHSVELNECASVAGASTWQQQPYSSSGGNSAILEIYTFGTAAAAQSAFEAVDAGMGSCQATSRALQTANQVKPDAVCSQTASAGGAVAFERTWTGVGGISAAGPQINHLYLAESGTTLLVLHFDEFSAGGGTAGEYDVHDDPSVLTMLTGLLAHGPAGS
jgi:hypothetical protein